MVSRPAADRPVRLEVADANSSAPTPRPDLSVVIVSWNTRDLLARCLGSILRGTVAGSGLSGFQATVATSIEVLVVDNGSVDGSPAMVRQDFPEARLIENHGNPGFARANNQAIRSSSGRYVLLLNPDTEARPGALEALVSFMDEHRQAGAAGALVLNPDGTLQRSCFRSPSLARELWRLFHLDALYPFNNYPMEAWDWYEPRPVDVVQGACLIARREALDRVWLLDEDYFIYSEEFDLCERLRRGGWTIHWVPGARVLHHGGQSTRQVAEAMFLQLYRAKIQYFRKRHGRRSAQVYKLILLLAASVRLLLGPLTLLESPPRRRDHLVIATHYRQLIRKLPWL